MIFIAALCALVSACRTSSGVAESSPNHFKWYVDEFWESGSKGIEETDQLADAHCRKYKKRAVWAEDFSPRSFFKYRNYTCIPEDKYICKVQLLENNDSRCKVQAKTRVEDSSGLSGLREAESKCTSLGFKQGTEKFAECVLQLSR